MVTCEWCEAEIVWGGATWRIVLYSPFLNTHVGECLSNGHKPLVPSGVYDLMEFPW